MKKFWILSVVLFLGAAFFLHPSKTSGQKDKFLKSPGPIPNRYIVVLDETIVGESAVAPVIEAEASYLTSVYGGHVDDVYSAALKGFSVEMSPEQAEMLSRDERVRFVEEDSIVSISAAQPNAPWHLDRVDQRLLPLDTNFDFAQTGAGVHAYIVDTGIRITHSQFGGRASVALDVIGDGQNGNDCNGHGTHVAGIVGGSTYGVAKSVSLHAVRALPCSGYGEISDIIRAADWITANRIDPAVVNISITAPGMSNSLETAISNSIASGVTYVIAAGNSSTNACDYTPARTPNAITVGATLATDVRAGYSNVGPCVDIFAPGHFVTSAISTGDTDTRTMSGTSMAAPMVVGVAALYLSANPNASPNAVAQAVVGGATSGVVTNIDGTSPNKLLYSWLAGAPAPPPTATPTPTPAPTPTPNRPAQIRIRKRVHNSTGGASSTATFPYAAINLAATNFVLADNQYYEDANVQVSNGQTIVSVTESAMQAFELISIECTEVSTGLPSSQNTTVDLAGRRASIIAEPGESIDCTFTSQPVQATAAEVGISGRVVNTAGHGVRGAVLTLLNPATGQAWHARTNGFGYYRFDGIEVANFYVLTLHSSKRHPGASASRSFTLDDELTGMDFVVDDSR